MTAVLDLSDMHKPQSLRVASGLGDDRIAASGRPVSPGEAIALSGVCLSFGGVQALQDIDLVVRPGEIRAIIGPNGAGKSSIINLISGVYRPDRGTIAIGADVFAAVPSHKLALIGLARTFQNLALFQGLTVLENIVAGVTFRNRSSVAEQVLGLPRARRERRDAVARATSILDFLQLSIHADRKAGVLPYGLQKRVELARALVASPRILLLDEPLAGMTATEKGEMASFIRAVRDAFATTILLIEHDVGVVMGLSDRITVLDHGRKIAEGTPSDIAANQQVIDAYLGVPPENEDGAGI